MLAVVDQVLSAPDVFMAAALIKSNGMTVGRGDFHKAILKLAQTD